MNSENPYTSAAQKGSALPPVSVPPPVIVNPYWPIQATARNAAISIPAILAIMLVGAVCFRYMLHGGSEDVPELFKYAFTTILGFYFGVGTGTAVHKPSSN